MPFTFKKLEIPDVILITPKVFEDDRGFFMETYKQSDFESNGIQVQFVQDNHSSSSKGVLRGLHYQVTPFEQAKLVRCIVGEILDVAVDLRPQSPTFGKWVSVILNSTNKRSLFIPTGFAHGFYTISDVAEITYKASNQYSSEHERTIMWNDNDINISWSKNSKILSQKDKIGMSLKDAFIKL